MNVNTSARVERFLTYAAICLIAAGIGYFLGSEEAVPRVLYQFSFPTVAVPPSNSSIDPARILEHVNDARTKHEKQALVASSALEYAAYLRARDILANQEFSHEATKSGSPFSTYVKKLNYRYQKIHENLARGYKNEQAVVDSWMASPKHREIVLSEGQEAGIYTLDGKLFGEKTTITVLIVAKK